MIGGINLALVVQRKENRALEAVALAEDLGEHGQAFLTAIFLIAREQDDVLALSGAFLAFIGDVVIGCLREKRAEQHSEKRCEDLLHKMVSVG